jgi:hypothetical protein
MHTCHAIECKVSVPPAMLMCKKHWFSVPSQMRNAVWKHYRGGQEGDWKPSKEYCEAAKAAVRAAAESEGRVVTGEEKELKFYDVFMPKE